jgi:hypothetical protein
MLQEHNHDAHVQFIDLVKAYDTVNPELLWKILERFGVPPQMILSDTKTLYEVHNDECSTETHRIYTNNR